MKLPLSLIHSFVPLDLPTQKICETLTLLGIEVDGVVDDVLELSLTPNLGHALSALGVARELAAALQTPIHRQQISLVENGPSAIESKIKVNVSDARLCPRYMCRLIENVKIGPSPDWLKKVLVSCGLKPINNIVDVTNYVMFLVGQPLHAFDYDRLEGHTIEVVPAQTKFLFLGLDQVEREVLPETLCICDRKKPVALAGILGGQNSAVEGETKNVLLEAASFDPVAIRRGAKKLALHTESALRFEKGIDLQGIAEALTIAAYWISQLSGGTVAKGAIDVHKEPFAPKQIRCRIDKINHLLGTRLSQTEIEEILQRLGFKIYPLDNGRLRVEVPSYRNDVSEEIDLVEEVARLYGYNNIDRGISYSTPSPIPDDPVYLFEKTLRDRCVGLGLQEFLTPDLISPKLASLAPDTLGPDISLLKTLHAKTEEFSILRPSLLPGLLQVAKRNFDQKNLAISAFEIGRIHFLKKSKDSQGLKDIELPMAALLLTGQKTLPHWKGKADEVDFYDLKGLLEMLLEGVGIDTTLFRPSKHCSFHPGRQADMHRDGSIIGSFGEVHPRLLTQLDIKQRIFFAEFPLLHWMKLRTPCHTATVLPPFPSSERDWTLSLSPSCLMETVFASIQAVRPALLEKVALIDLYQPEGMEAKNATLRFTYRDPLTTISNETVDTLHTHMMQQVTKLLAK